MLFYLLRILIIPLNYVVDFFLVQIQKSVFGATIVGAEINQGLLIVLHKANKIMVYSLAAVCNQQV